MDNPRLFIISVIVVAAVAVVIIIILYFLSPFLTLAPSSIFASCQPLLFIPFFSPLPSAKIPQTRICTLVTILHFLKMSVFLLMHCLPCESWSSLPANRELCPESTKCIYEHFQSIWELLCTRGCVFTDMRWL